MKMKKIVTALLMVILTNIFFVQSALAENDAEKHERKIRTEVAKLGTGPDAKIRVKLKDKTKIKGYIVETSDDRFVIMDEKTGETVPVSYPQVRQARGNNLSTGAIIAIGVIGFLVLVFVLASKAS
jgi:hypothetical protein